jgi:Fic family protein
MSDLERFINDDAARSPVLMKAALAHAQFETIHPFLDGNGRLGRLLVTMLLVSEGVLRQPLLYLSLYLKRHRDLYYERLQRIRTHGEWEAWLTFFLDGVTEVATATAATTTELVSMIEHDRRRVSDIGRGAATAARVHEYLVREIVGRPQQVAKAIGMSQPPVNRALTTLQRMRIVREVTGRQRGRLYVYDQYLNRLNADT